MWLLLLAACGARDPAPAPDWRAEVDAWTWPDPLPDLPLVDQDGRSFSLGSLSDRWVLLGFIYAGCDDALACPMTMHRMRAVQRAAGDRVHLLSLTLDPGNDTPERLRAFGLTHGADLRTWTLATGDEKLLATDLPSMFSVLSLPKEGGLTHSVKIALLRPGLVTEAEWTDDFDASAVIARLPPP